MIYVTEAPNDADLLRELGSMAIPAPIPHGDVVFFGKWEADSVDKDAIDIRVLVERKKIPDMVNSILTGRYLSQAQAAHEAGFKWKTLIVEGDMQPGLDGFLEMPHWQNTNGKKKRVWLPVTPLIQYSRFDQYLSEVSLFLGIMVKRSVNVKETAAQVKALWLLYQKPPSEHHSLKSIYTTPVPGQNLLLRPSLVRRMAKELVGVGWQRSGDVDKRFKSIREMVDATEKDWLEIPGVGKKTAKSVVMALNGLRGG